MTDQQPLVEREGQGMPPPPAYRPVENKTTAPQTSTTAMKLPTYDQSEKFSKGDVVLVTAVPMDEDSDDGGEEVGQRKALFRSGNLFEFILFFFSFFGIVLAFCFATSVAAQSGAIAGLGATFVIQPVLYEFYYRNYEHNMSVTWCSAYASNTEDQLQQNCIHRTTIGIRLVLLTFGLIGLVLLYKGFSGYFRSIRSSNTNN